MTWSVMSTSQLQCPQTNTSMHIYLVPTCLCRTLIRNLLHQHWILQTKVVTVNSGNIPAWCAQAEPKKHSRWIHSRCRVFAPSRAGPGRLECQTHYYRWNWRWPCLPDLEQWEQHCQGLCTSSWRQMWDTMAKYWYWGHGCVCVYLVLQL